MSTPGTGAGGSRLKEHPIVALPKGGGFRPRRSRGVNLDHPKTDVYTKREASDIYQALTGIVDWESVDGDLFFFFF